MILTEIKIRAVWWFSCRAVLTGVFQSRSFIDLLVEQYPIYLGTVVMEWLSKLAYFTDIFVELNKLKMAMQGQVSNVIQLYNELDLWGKLKGREHEWVLKTFLCSPPWKSIRTVLTKADLQPPGSRVTSAWEVFFSLSTCTVMTNAF